MQLILGSKSQGRKKILEDAGYNFEIVPADIDEKAIRHDDPHTLTEAIACAKADALREKFPEHIIITGDTVGFSHNTILEKPASAEEYKQNIVWATQEPLELVSAVVVTNTKNNKQLAATDVATVQYSDIPNSVVDDILATGAYKPYAAGIAIEEPRLLPFITVTGEYGTAMGLPLKKFKELLTQIQ